MCDTLLSTLLAHPGGPFDGKAPEVGTTYYGLRGTPVFEYLDQLFVTIQVQPNDFRERRKGEGGGLGGKVGMGGKSHVFDPSLERPSKKKSLAASLSAEAIASMPRDRWPLLWAVLVGT